VSPLDAFQEAVRWSALRPSSHLRNPYRPGEVIEMLDPEARDALARLTSDEVRGLRPELWRLSKN